MSKSIYDEAQKNAKWLRDYIIDVFYNERILSDHVQRSTEQLDIIKLALEQAQKQEKLLDLYIEYIKELENMNSIYNAEICEHTKHYHIKDGMLDQHMNHTNEILKKIREFKKNNE